MKMSKTHQENKLSVAPKRDALVDCLKGYACLLVVIGHIILGIRNSGLAVPFFSQPAERFIWSFHMALFMFLSGYVYKITGEWKGKKSRGHFFLHKALNLGIPYLAFSVLYIVVNSITPGTNHEKHLSDILFLWKTPVAQYWFLYALLILFVLWTVLSLFLKNWQITLILFVFHYIVKFTSLDVGPLNYGLIYALVFGLGTFVPSLIIDKWSVIKKSVIILAHILILGIFIAFKLSDLPFIDDFCRLLGISASIALISVLTKNGYNGYIKRFLLFINKYSFPIYLLHTFFTSFVRIALTKIGIENYWIHCAAAMILGVVCPIIIAMITNKAAVLDFFFYPSKSIKRIKNKISKAKVQNG